MKPIKRISSKKYGDTVAAVAQPIAGFIDKVAGTNLSNCKGCKKRQKALNDLFDTRSK